MPLPLLVVFTPCRTIKFEADGLVPAHTEASQTRARLCRRAHRPCLREPSLEMQNNDVNKGTRLSSLVVIIRGQVEPTSLENICQRFDSFRFVPQPNDGLDLIVPQNQRHSKQEQRAGVTLAKIWYSRTGTKCV